MAESLVAVRDLLVGAIQRVMAEITASVPKEELFGFALCTDNDVSGVFHVYATRDWVAENEPDYPDIGYIFVEWTQQADDANFDEASAALRDWSRGDARAFETPIRFEAMARAMEICVREGLFAASTALLVYSSDPDPELVILGNNALSRFNSPELAQKIRDALGH